MNQVALLVHELKQVEGDRTFDSIGLDGMYHFHHDDSLIWHVAVEDQSPEDDWIELKVGDEILVDQANFVANCGQGTNSRTKKKGYYLLTKVLVLTKTAKYLSFS